MIKTQLPVHFDFDSRWLRDILPQRKKPGFQKAFERIQALYEDLADYMFEESLEYDRELAEMKLKLDLHIAQVCCFDLHWIRDTFDEQSVADFSLDLAQAYDPEQEWMILEYGDYAIVTNSDRSMVFDLMNCRLISAATSLVLAHDSEFQPPRSALEEAVHFQQGKMHREQMALEKLETLVANPPARGKLSLVPDLIEDESH